MTHDHIIPTPPSPLVMTASEIDLLRDRIEAALKTYAPDTRRVYSSSLRIFATWFVEWIYEAPVEIQNRLGYVVSRMHDQGDWWSVIQGMMIAGSVVSTTVAATFLAETSLQKTSKGRCDQTPSTATKATRIAAVRFPFALMHKLGVIPWDLRSVRAPRVTPYRDVHGPDVDQIRRMLDVTKDSEPIIAARDRVIVRLAFRGLRRKEIAEPLVGHYVRDRDPRVLSILGKARDDRELISIPAPTFKAIEDYLSHRGWPEPGAPLIARHDYSGDGLPMSARSVYQRIRVLAERGGVVETNSDKHIGPHKLRRSAITTGLNATGGDLRSVQAFGRHSRADVTMRYDDARRDVAGQVAQLLDDLLDHDQG